MRIVGGIMRIGSIVMWKYSGKTMFIVVSMDKQIMERWSATVVGVKSGKTHTMFLSDLEVLCE